MHPNDIEFFQKVQEMYTEFLTRNTETQTRAAAVKTIEEIANIIRASREITDMLEEMAKLSRGALDQLTRLICLRWAKESETGEPVRTPYVRISPDVKLAATLPKKGTDEYKALLTTLGFSQELIETDAVRPHWPGMTDLIATCMAEGKRLPEGLSMDKTYPVYSIKVYKVKGITE